MIFYFVDNNTEKEIDLKKTAIKHCTDCGYADKEIEEVLKFIGDLYLMYSIRSRQVAALAILTAMKFVEMK